MHLIWWSNCKHASKSNMTFLKMIQLFVQTVFSTNSKEIVKICIFQSDVFDPIYMVAFCMLLLCMMYMLLSGKAFPHNLGTCHVGRIEYLHIEGHFMEKKSAVVSFFWYHFFGIIFWCYFFISFFCIMFLYNFFVSLQLLDGRKK